MTLLERTTTFRRGEATRATRNRVLRVEKRADEIAVVAEVETDYQRADRAGDLQMESWFSKGYQSAPSEEWRAYLLEGFLLWGRTERAEEGVVCESVGDAVELLKGNNGLWLHDGCGPDGTAA
jgi:hypothetical protein